MKIMLKKGNILKYDIIHIKFKCCVSQIYFIVLLPNKKARSIRLIRLVISKNK